MKFILTKQINLSYLASFKEPLWDAVENRLTLLKKITKTFDLRLNDLKFNNDTPSNNFIKFYKFYGETFLDVSFGLEEISARLGIPKSEEQISELYNRLYSIIPPEMVIRQNISIERHLSVQGDLSAYLEKLNPNIPKEFNKIIAGRGVNYSLKFQENDLTVQVMATNSLFIPGGLFLNLIFDFSPNKYDFLGAFSIAKKQHEFILSEMNIEIETGEA